MRVLLDTNIIFDLLLEREPFLQDAELLFQKIAAAEVIGYVTATTLTDIFYIARRHTQSIEKARAAIAMTLQLLEVSPVDRAILELALASDTPDFEDAVQAASAVSQGLDDLITRDTDFSAASIPVLSVRQWLQQLEAASED